MKYSGFPLRQSQKGLTLIEVLIVVILSGLIVIGLGVSIGSSLRASTNLMLKFNTQQEVVYAQRHILEQVRGASTLEITTDPTGLILFDRDGNTIHTYTLDGTTLNFDGTSVSENVTNLTITSVNPAGATTEVKAIEITATIEEPNTSVAVTLTTGAFAHIPVAGGSGVVFNFTQNKFYNTIQEAVDEASDGDEIRAMGDVRADGGEFDGIFLRPLGALGTMVTIPRNKRVVLKGGYDQEFLTQDVVRTPTVLEGEGGTTQGINVTAEPGRDVAIDGFTIQNMSLLGIRSRDTDLIIRNCIVEDIDSTSSSSYGIDISAGEVTVLDNVTVRNTRVGMAIFYGLGDVTISNSDFSNNGVGVGGEGVRLINENGSSSRNPVLTITNTTMADNEGENIYILASSGTPFGEALVSGCQITGGGEVGMNIFPQASFPIVVRNCTLSNNVGGISVGGADRIVEDCTIQNNERYGVMVRTVGAGNPVVIRNNTMGGVDGAGDPAGNGASGVSIDLSNTTDASVDVIGNTITNNRSPGGGGVRVFGRTVTRWTVRILNNNISDNQATSSSGYAGGGGIFIHTGATAIQGTIQIENNVIRNNTSIKGGGGIKEASGSGPITEYTIRIVNNDISFNRETSRGSGGGISIRTSDATDSSLEISNNNILGNQAPSSGGGVLLGNADRFSPFVFSRNRIEDNATGTYGGGIVFSGSPEIRDNIISGNAASLGAGISHVTGGSRGQRPTIRGNTIANNSRAILGGGIFFDRYSEPTIRNNLIRGNSAPRANGGGVFLHFGTRSVVMNNIFHGNTAPIGAGLFLSNPKSSPSARATIENNVVTGNSGAGIGNPANVHVKGCIFFGNTGVPMDGGSAQYAWGSGRSGTGNLEPTAAPDDTPQFVDFPNDFHLAVGSLAIDAGRPGDAFNDPDDTQNDMGAFGGPGAADGVGALGNIGVQGSIGPQ